MSDVSKKIKIENLSSAILAILLMAIYFIKDFLADTNLIIAAVYAFIVYMVVISSSKKTEFYETISELVKYFIISQLLKCVILYFKSIEWFIETFFNSFELLPSNYIELLFTTPYLYFYLIGIVMLLICCYAPNLCKSEKLKKVLDTIGRYSVCAVIAHMIAVCFHKYLLIENIIFYVFMIAAFWEAYTERGFDDVGLENVVILILGLAAFVIFYPIQYAAFIGKFQNATNISWIYVIALFLICFCCIFQEQSSKDTILGFIILGTCSLIFYQKLCHLIIPTKLVLLFNIVALTFYYFVKSVFDLNDQNKGYLRGLLGLSYIIALLLVAFIDKKFTMSLLMLSIGLLVSFIYFGNFFQIKGTIYGMMIYGAVPWILLATTMSSLGKLKLSLLSVVLFIVLFWCVCSVALSWKDTANIKSIAFEKTNSEKIINGLSGIAYLLTVVMLFV
ncbi:hypothetical protein [Catenibacterium mitsuokai]|uniref:hypothetical protein n=1 Tax=Catenibacterium mitsuokai TaxID=100886 RepID=UPI003F8C189D